MAFDLILHAKTVLTMDPLFREVEDGAILIKAGKIEAIGRSAEFEGTDARRVLHYPHGLAMPGLVNTHTHVPMSLFRGLADDLPLNRWLEEYIFPAEAQFVNPHFAYWGAMLSCAEMVLSGTTCFADGYFYEHDVARAVESFGMRAVLAQGIIDFPAPGVPDPKRNIEAAEDFVHGWKGRHPLITPALFCHSTYTCSAETIVSAKKAARNRAVPFFIHLAETRTEEEIVRQRYGKTPTGFLDSLDVLDAQTMAVHCIWLNEEDMDILAAKSVGVSHTPESEMKLASGAPPMQDLLDRGAKVSLGTDGCASNNDMDMFLEMDVAAKLEKLRRLDPAVLSAREMLRLGTMGGATALGLDSEIGSIEKGKRADIIVLDMKKPHLIPLYDCYSQLVYAAKGSDVVTTIVDGNVLVEHGETVHRDVEELYYQAGEIAKKIADALRPH